MRRSDTSDRAAAVAAEVNRNLGPERRFIQALQLSDLLRQMAEAGLRSRHPQYSEEELVRALTIQLYGEVPQRK